ncbi:MAG: hypothetical protein ACTHK5_06450 [Tsuneonella sp.]
MEFEIEEYPRQMDDYEPVRVDPPTTQRDRGRSAKRLRPLVRNQDQAVFIPEQAAGTG